MLGIVGVNRSNGCDSSRGAEEAWVDESYKLEFICSEPSELYVADPFNAPRKARGFTDNVDKMSLGRMYHTGE